MQPPARSISTQKTHTHTRIKETPGAVYGWREGKSSISNWVERKIEKEQLEDREWRRNDFLFAIIIVFYSPKSIHEVRSKADVRRRLFIYQ